MGAPRKQASGCRLQAGWDDLKCDAGADPSAPLKDDIAPVAYWYQADPHAAFPTLPAKDELEIQ